MNRPKGDGSVIFLHFHNTVELLINGQRITTRTNACIFYGPDTPQWFKSEDLLIHDWMHLSPDTAEIIVGYGLKIDSYFTRQILK